MADCGLLKEGGGGGPSYGLGRRDRPGQGFVVGDPPSQSAKKGASWWCAKLAGSTDASRGIGRAAGVLVWKLHPRCQGRREATIHVGFTGTCRGKDHFRSIRAYEPIDNKQLVRKKNACAAATCPPATVQGAVESTDDALKTESQFKALSRRNTVRPVRPSWSPTSLRRATVKEQPRRHAETLTQARKSKELVAVTVHSTICSWCRRLSLQRATQVNESGVLTG